MGQGEQLYVYAWYQKNHETLHLLLTVVQVP